MICLCNALCILNSSLSCIPSLSISSTKVRTMQSFIFYASGSGYFLMFLFLHCFWHSSPSLFLLRARCLHWANDVILGASPPLKQPAGRPQVLSGKDSFSEAQIGLIPLYFGVVRLSTVVYNLGDAQSRFYTSLLAFSTLLCLLCLVPSLSILFHHSHSNSNVSYSFKLFFVSRDRPIVLYIIRPRR